MGQAKKRKAEIEQLKMTPQQLAGDFMADPEGSLLRIQNVGPEYLKAMTDWLGTRVEIVTEQVEPYAKHQRCYDNCVEYVRRNPAAKLVHGWVAFYNNGRERLHGIAEAMEHFVVEVDGRLIDITPLDHRVAQRLGNYRHFWRGGDWDPKIGFRGTVTWLDKHYTHRDYGEFPPKELLFTPAALSHEDWLVNLTCQIRAAIGPAKFQDLLRSGALWSRRAILATAPLVGIMVMFMDDD